MTREAAISLLKKVIAEFTDTQQNTLRQNLAAGNTILCGQKAYMFCDSNAGCLLTLSSMTGLPTDKYEFKKIEEICIKMAPIYNQVVKRYGLDYYHATQVLDCPTLTALVLEVIG